MVSIIIPNYNHAPYLAQRIQSVLNQTYTDFECIILDDASTDNSKDIIESYAANDGRISFYFSPSNSGSPFIQWNKGIQKARGEFIWIAESDDLANADFLQTMVKHFIESPAVALVYSQSYKINDTGNITGNWKEWTDTLNEALFENDFYMNGQKYIEQFLVYKNTIPNASAVVFKKAAYVEAGGANETIRNCSDWLCWLKILCRHDVAFVAKPLNYFRYHQNSVIAKEHARTSTVYEKEFDYYMRKEFDKYVAGLSGYLYTAIKKINDRFIYHAIGNDGLHNFKAGNKLEGLKQILQASIHPGINLNFIKRLLVTKASAT